VKTSLYSILCIVIRLGAVLLFVNIMTGLPFAMTDVQGSQYGPGAQGVVVGTSGALIALAVLLWLYAGVLARLATSRLRRHRSRVRSHPANLSTSPSPCSASPPR